MATMVTRTICTRHDFHAFVGSAVQFALDYYECPSCVREQDADYERRQWPCCSRANIDCCGHDDEPQPWLITITSPCFCDHRESPRLCGNALGACGHESCAAPPF